MKKPLMPKATAVWLIENTTLSFEQISHFCQLHELEVQGIADGDVARGIRGADPIAAGQLTRAEIENCQEDPDKKLHGIEKKEDLPKFLTFLENGDPSRKIQHLSNSSLDAFLQSKVVSFEHVLSRASQFSSLNTFNVSQKKKVGNDKFH